MDEPLRALIMGEATEIDDLHYLRKSLIRRFHGHSPAQVEDALQLAVLNLAPRRARAAVVREVVRILRAE